MSDEARNFIDCLQDAEQLLENYLAVNHFGVNSTLSDQAPGHFDLALFEKWSEFLTRDKQQKSTIRIIQHLSCSGGTIMSKCLAGLPNVVILSEVNPLSELHVESNPPGFAPTDLLYLAKRAKVPHFEELCKEVFKAEIGVITEHARLFGKHLVIREHSHSDFLMGETPKSYSTIKMFLNEDYMILSALTVRHPIDSFLSLSKTNWMNFTPRTFEEYCKRYSLFIDSNENSPVYKYEDFVSNPAAEIKLICGSLDLPYNPDFIDVFDIYSLSGDSGRSSNDISVRKRREINESFRKELAECRNYRELCERLGYETSLDIETKSDGEEIEQK